MRVSFAHVEHAGVHQALAKAGCEAVDGGPDVDRAAELVQECLVLGRAKNRKGTQLLVASDEPSRDARCLERCRSLADVGPADHDALAPEHSFTELAFEPLPLSPCPNRKPNEPFIVMSMPKDPSAPGGLPGPRRGRLEANERGATPPQRISRG